MAEANVMASTIFLRGGGKIQAKVFSLWVCITLFGVLGEEKIQRLGTNAEKCSQLIDKKSKIEKGHRRANEKLKFLTQSKW